jgi:hypothetical protein
LDAQRRRNGRKRRLSLEFKLSPASRFARRGHGRRMMRSFAVRPELPPDRRGARPPISLVHETASGWPSSSVRTLHAGRRAREARKSARTRRRLTRFRPSSRASSDAPCHRFHHLAPFVGAFPADQTGASSLSDRLTCKTSKLARRSRPSRVELPKYHFSAAQLRAAEFGEFLLCAFPGCSAQ